MSAVKNIAAPLGGAAWVQTPDRASQEFTLTLDSSAPRATR